MKAISLFMFSIIFPFIPELMAKMEKRQAATDEPPSDEED